MNINLHLTVLWFLKETYYHGSPVPDASAQAS